METHRQLHSHNYKTHEHASLVVEYPVGTMADWIEDMEDMNTSQEVPMVVLQSTALQRFLTQSINKGMFTAICSLVCGACFSTQRLPTSAVIQTVPLQDTYIVLSLA